MSTAKPPFDPNPEREDAFGEFARQGFAESTDGTHVERLARLRTRTSGQDGTQISERTPTSTPRPQLAVERQLPTARIRRLPLRWLAVAASVLLIVVVGWLLRVQQTEVNTSAPLASLPDERVEGQILEPAVVQTDASSASDTELSPDAVPSRANADFERRAQAAPGASKPSAALQENEVKSEGWASDRPTPTANGTAPSAGNLSEPPVVRARARNEEYAQVTPPVVSAVPPPRSAPPSAAPSPSGAISPETARTKRADAARAPAAVTTPVVTMPAADAVFELARDPAPVFREVTGQLTTLNREPLTAAKLYVEATGQSVPLDWSGSFRFSLASNTPVLVAVAEGFDTIYLDASRESELQIALANQFSNRFGEVRAARAPRSSLLVPARASLNQPFENFQAASLGAEVVERLRRAEVSFLVDRAGLVKQVAAGPGVRLTPLELARAEELLTRGPAWPERYRRASWRYTVVVE